MRAYCQHVSSDGPSLFVAYSGKSGGAGRFLVDVVTGLPGPAVVACPPGELASACRDRGVPVVELPERPLELRGGVRARGAAGSALAGHAREIGRVVRAIGPSLVFTWGMRSALAAAAGLPRGRGRPPWIARHHDFLPSPAIGSALRRALGRADAVVVNSRAVRGRPGAAAAGRGDPAGRGPEPLHADADRASTASCGSGAIVDWKRPELALEILARTPDQTLRLAGAPIDPDGERIVERLAARAAEPDLAGRVDLPGAVDPADALRTAQALLHTADREPFGIALAEALASGVPVVAPAAAGPVEIVDESCGRLFPPGDAEAAATALAEVLDRETALAAGARRRAEEQFDLERARARFIELVERHTASPVRSPRAGDELALVTVTHDSADELEALLASAARHLPGAQVVVVDSGSSDDGIEVARRHGAETIALENVGYGRSANAGLEVVTRPVTVVLNPDVELVDSSLADMAEELARGREPERLLVPAVVLPDGSRQDVAQHEPATLPLLVSALVPPAALPRRLRPGLDPWRSTRPRRVGWPVGACIAARTETLRSLGPFDTDIFLYGEDLDLGLRAADARHRDVVLAAMRASSTSAPTRRAARSMASRSSCSPAAAAT